MANQLPEFLRIVDRTPRRVTRPVSAKRPWLAVPPISGYILFSARVDALWYFSVMRRSVSFRWQSIICIMVVGVSYLSGQQTRPVAYVLDVTGNWQIEGQQGAVKAGQPLTAGSKLSTASYNYDNAITLVQYDDASRTRISCENSSKNPCLKPIVVSSSPDSPTSQFKMLMAAAFSALLEKPPPVANHYSATLGRGKYIIVEREDVVPLDDVKGFSLTGRIPALPVGTYSVAATSNDGRSPSVSARVATLADGSWQAFPITVPGLYTISVTDSDGQHRADLVFLFVPIAGYTAARQRFDAVKDRTSKWQGANAQVDEHILLRAVLLAMSQSS